jgi:hypothetical protein
MAAFSARLWKSVALLVFLCLFLLDSPHPLVYITDTMNTTGAPARS